MERRNKMESIIGGLFVILFLFLINFTSAISVAVNIPEKYNDVLAGERFYFEVDIKYPENPARKSLILDYEISTIEGELCDESICGNVSYNVSAGVAVFNVTRFSSYVTQGNSQLEIWDETDPDFPYANQTKYPNEQVKFFANYTKKNNDQPITGATCIINFSDSGGTMSYNNSISVYEFNRSFVSNGTFDWNVTCSATGAQTLTTIDTALINASLDTCTYSGSGNWEVDCSDNCVINSNVDLLGNDISIIGYGSFSTTADITNWNDLYIEGTSSSNRCEVYCSGGGCFK